ncbi:MAG: hypothetical protein QM679_00010 [Patulibacter sp.]
MSARRTASRPDLLSRAVRRRVAALLMSGVSLLVPHAAHGAAYLPPDGKRFHGVTGGSSPTNLKLFDDQIGSHPAIFGFFTQWNSPYQYIFNAAQSSRARVMLHISTTQGYGASERITPKGIAQGGGDRYLIGLAREIAERDVITYVRFLAEMNQTNNAYCAFDASGRFRGASHSQGQYKQAFRRAALILRGGSIDAINRKLKRLGLPAVQGTSADLPVTKVAMAWVPQVAGTPNIAANSARAYYPGRAYVDWVGTDFYSAFPNFSGLRRFSSDFNGIPFMFGEYAAWKSDSASFIHALFAFIRGDHDVKIAMYNQGNLPNGPFKLVHYPASRTALRGELAKGGWAQYAPEYAS